MKNCKKKTTTRKTDGGKTGKLEIEFMYKFTMVDFFFFFDKTTWDSIHVTVAFMWSCELVFILFYQLSPSICVAATSVAYEIYDYTVPSVSQIFDALDHFFFFGNA